MTQVKMIFFDAVGTLFGVRGNVGQIYGHVAQHYGVVVEPQALDRAFYQAFQAAPPALFPKVGPQQLADLEQEWWRQIVIQTFAQVEGVDQGSFSDFEAFFREVFDLFATAQPWQIYTETFEVLQDLQGRGFQLGIISNFDSRLLAVLQSLGLDPFFASVTISTQTGAAKPDRQVFQTALEQAQISAAEALHVGDSFSMDYQGAKRAGLWALWLGRAPETQQRSSDEVPEQERISDLRGIWDWITAA